MKVVYELGVAGYIETVRGQNGGMRLARQPGDIVLGEVVRRTEPDIALVPCFDPINAACVISPACKLRRALQQARSAFLAVLDNYTLADLVENRDALSALLAQGAHAAAKPKIRRPKEARPKTVESHPPSDRAEPVRGE